MKKGINEFAAKLMLLGEILNIKHDALLGIKNITDNQGAVFSQNENGSLNVMLNEMNIEKQALIDKVIEADERFQTTFDSLGEAFENNAQEHPTEIAGMQDMIKKIFSLDTEIRIAEEKNKKSYEQKRAGSAMAMPVRRKQAAQIYAKNKNYQG